MQQNDLRSCRLCLLYKKFICDIVENIIEHDADYYDLNRKLFKEGKYSDLIKMNFKFEFHKKEGKNIEMMTMIKQILSDKITRDSFLTAVASCMNSDRKEHKVYKITYNEGCNGLLTVT